jgi:hypothetical protein
VRCASGAEPATPKAPIVVETTGHFLANVSAIFTRVPPPNWMGTAIADQVAISSPGSASHPSFAIPASDSGENTSLPSTNRSQFRVRNVPSDPWPHVLDEPTS